MKDLKKLGELIKKERLNKGLTQEELAKAVGYTSRSSINKIELGLIDLPQSKIAKFAEVLNISPIKLLGFSENQELFPLTEWKKIPVYEKISCGNGCFVEDKVIDYIAVPAELIRNNDCFAVKATGDSMNNFGIFDGDILVFQSNQEINNNDIVAICIDDENTAICKKIKFINNGVLLIPGNDNYETILITPDKKCHIMGKLVFSLKKF